jgi:hypothetical protein
VPSAIHQFDLQHGQQFAKLFDMISKQRIFSTMGTAKNGHGFNIHRMLTLRELVKLKF